MVVEHEIRFEHVACCSLMKPKRHPIPGWQVRLLDVDRSQCDIVSPQDNTFDAHHAGSRSTTDTGYSGGNTEVCRAERPTW